MCNLHTATPFMTSCLRLHLCYGSRGEQVPPDLSCKT